MAPKPFWKGYLKLSLVTCPVAMMPAVSDSDKLRFHTMNRKTGNRVVSQYVDSKTGDVVEPDDQVKGYQRGEDSYVLLEDEEIEAVGLESTRTIDIDMFVPAASISAIWRDRPHFLFPDDEVGEEAFSVIREAMLETEMVGISRVVLYRRERAVMLEPRGKGIVLWTLRYGDEVRAPASYFDDIDDAKAKPEQEKLMSSLIKAKTTEWDEDLVDDPVQEKLLALIEEKKKEQRHARKPKSAPEGAGTTGTDTGNVINIMDALRKSLKQGGGSGKQQKAAK